MKIKQYVYFAIRSASVPTEQLEARIGLAADRSVVRGSRIAEPARPAHHAWEVVCDAPGLTVDQQIARVMARLTPYRDAIEELLTSTEDADAALQVVRYFGVGPAEDGGDEEADATTHDGLEKLPGQHQLLGFHLAPDVLTFVLDIRAEIDFDEYG